MTDGYEFGGRDAEIQHGIRELMQLRAGLKSGALTRGEYDAAAAGVREKYGLVLGEVNTGP